MTNDWIITLADGSIITVSMWLLIGLGLLAFCAGFIDAVVGGGGLVLLPALLAFFPHVAIPIILGTNKMISLAGTTTSSLRYAKSVPLQWSWLLWGFLLALIFSIIGGKIATVVTPQVFRPLILIFLILVAWHTFRPQSLLPTTAIDKKTWWRGKWGLLGVCAILSFYDGFFGPGTGMFIIFALSRFFSFSFLHASAHAKVINMASNLGALIFFLPNGFVIWQLALILAVASISGSYLGSHLAIKKGSSFVKIMFRIVVATLLTKIILDTVGIRVGS